MSRASGDPGWKLTPLACPRCAGILDPLATDVTFVCAGCGGACELVGGRTEPREMRWLGAGPWEGGTVVELPFWRLEPGWVTPAFNGSRLLTLTEWYSPRLADVPLRHGPRPRGLWGGSIGSKDAWRVCRLVFERAERENVDCATELLGIPFRTEASHLVCLVTGLHIYFETIEASDRLLDRWATCAQT